MRTLILILAGSLLNGQVAAQSVKQPTQQPSWVVINDSIVGELVLTAAQRQMLHDMELRYQDNLDDVLAREDELGSDEIHRRIAALSEDREREIQLIMNPEQYRQWVRLRGTGEKASLPAN